MTLIIHIPYNSGIVVISDNQNSYLEGYTVKAKEFVEKSYVDLDKNIVIVCAGETLLYKNMFHRLRTDNTIDYTNIIDKIKFYLLGKNKEGILVKQDELADIESIVVTKANGNILSMNMIGHIEQDSIKKASFTTIGSKKIHSQIQMIKFDITALTKDDAIRFGLSLIDYIAVDDNSVGRTNEFGANIIIIPQDGKIIQKEITPDSRAPENFFKCIASLINFKKVVI